jgi:hypothetical protein
MAVRNRGVAAFLKGGASNKRCATKFLIVVSLLPGLLCAQADPVFEAYKAWDSEHRRSDYKARAQSLFEVSAQWVAQWPESRLAWEQRRNSLVETHSRSPELWKQVDENLIRLSSAHTFASLAAYDWVTAAVNVKQAESLLASEGREDQPLRHSLQAV